MDSNNLRFENVNTMSSTIGPYDLKFDKEPQSAIHHNIV